MRLAQRRAVARKTRQGDANARADALRRRSRAQSPARESGSAHRSARAQAAPQRTRGIPSDRRTGPDSGEICARNVKSGPRQRGSGSQISIGVALATERGYCLPGRCAGALGEENPHRLRLACNRCVTHMPQMRATGCPSGGGHATRAAALPRVLRPGPMDADARPKAARLHVPRPLSHRDARLIVLGMMLPVFMGSLDSTILATALPAIGRDLGT